MLRPGEQLLPGALLDHPPQVHHRDPVRDVFDDREVVSDEQTGEAELTLEVDEQVEDRCLDRHVQRGHRLVGHQQLRGEDERPGDPDPLTLTSGELVRAPGRVVRAQTDPGEHLDHPVPAVLPVADPVLAQRLGDHIADLHPGVHGGVGVLENHVRAAPQRPHPALAEVCDVVAEDTDGARRRLQEPDRTPGERGLAAAGLAHETDDLALADAQRDVLDRPHGPGLLPEVDADVLHPEDRAFAGRSHAHLDPSSPTGWKHQT